MLFLKKKITKSTRIGVCCGLRLRVAMWITHVGGQTSLWLEEPLINGTNLRGQSEPKRRCSQIFADSRLFLAKRPASYSDPKPQAPKLLAKKSKKLTPRSPTPNSLQKNSKIRKIPAKMFFCSRNFGVWGFGSL